MPLYISSRYLAELMVAQWEAAILAKRLITETRRTQQIKEQHDAYAARDPIERSKLAAHLLADIKETKADGRPHISHHIPSLLTQFTPLKYSLNSPYRVGSILDTRPFYQEFFSCSSTVHKHSDTDIGFMTPEQVHFSLTDHPQQHW